VHEDHQGPLPAVANAICHATGVQVTRLLMSPEYVWRTIQKQRPDLLEEVKRRLKESGGE